MATLLDYIEEVQHEHFYETELSTLDILALTEIGYLPFDHFVPYDFSLETAIRLDQLAAQAVPHFRENPTPLSTTTTTRIQLLEKLASTKRFKSIKVFGFINDHNLDQQKQFAAVSYRITRHQLLTVFRGTDDTLIGWKEDFHMTYMEQIPAQKSARNYLKKLMETLEGTFIVAGHSKGGNLSLYACSQLPIELQHRLQTIVAFDAPGLHRSVINSSGYQAIAHRIQSIIPQGSIVGKMLLTPSQALIVKSRAIGLIQHDTASWEIANRQFVEADALDQESIQMDKTLKTWMASLSDDELKHFFDLFFGLFLEAGIHRFQDLTIDTPDKLRQIIQNSQNLSEQENAMLEKGVKLLIDTRYQVWKKQTLPFFSPFQQKDKK